MFVSCYEFAETLFFKNLVWLLLSGQEIDWLVEVRGRVSLCSLRVFLPIVRRRHTAIFWSSVTKLFFSVLTRFCYIL